MKITKFERGKFGNPLGFIEYLPPNYDASKKYHTLFWLPGLGEVGSGTLSSLDRVANTALGNWLKTNDVDFIVFIPQDYSGYWPQIELLIDWCLTKYPSIDRGSIHLAGLSSGGYGVRDTIKRQLPVGKLIRTFTPMATNLMDANNSVQYIVENDQYVWTHQGNRDGDPNKVYAVAPFHDKLEAIAPERSRLTVYELLGHSTWNYVYNGTGIKQAQLKGTYQNVNLFNWTEGSWWDWMKSKAKGVVVPPVDPPVEPVKEIVVEQYVQEGYLYIKVNNKTYKGPLVTPI